MNEIKFAGQTNGYDRNQMDAYIRKLTDEYARQQQEYAQLASQYEKLQASPPAGRDTNAIPSMSDGTQPSAAQPEGDTEWRAKELKKQKFFAEFDDADPQPAIPAASNPLLEAYAVAASYPAVATVKPAPEKAKGDKRFAGQVFNILFYGAVIFILAVTLVFGKRPGANGGYPFFGYSGFVVLTGSMQQVIPEGALVLVRETDPGAIRAGDIITYKRSDNKIITHRVMDIYEDFEGSGAKGFQTRGDSNPAPDKEIVGAPAVFGVATHAVPKLGFALMYVSENIGLVCLVLGGLAISAVLLSIFFPGAGKTRRKDERQPLANRAWDKMGHTSQKGAVPRVE